MQSPPNPIGIQPMAPKRFIAGTHRVMSPEETLLKVRPFLPTMGITRIADVTGLDDLGVPVTMAIRPNSRSMSVSPGKGLTLAAAQASAVMESIEHWHAEHIELPLKFGSVRDLRIAHRLVQAHRLPRLSVTRFHDDLRMLWTIGVDFVSGAPTWVPFDLVHTDYSLPLVEATGAFIMSSNGLASGNHILEAVNHAICELVERDASTLWELSSQVWKQHTRLDPRTINDPDCKAILDRMEDAGVRICLWEITSDIGIPAYRCVLVDRMPSPLRPIAPMVGYGCHPSREIALLRAITEAAQTRLTLITGSRDDVRSNGHGPQEDLKAAQRFDAAWPDGPGPRAFKDAPHHASDTLDGDLNWILDRLRKAGLDEVVIVDLTRPAIPIFVVRAIIPELEALCEIPGYVPGARAARLREERAA